MPKKYTTIRISRETMEEIRKLRAWLELSTGERYSVDRTIREMATEFNRATTIPWEEIERIASKGS